MEGQGEPERNHSIGQYRPYVPRPTMHNTANIYCSTLLVKVASHGALFYAQIRTRVPWEETRNADMKSVGIL